MQIATYTKIQRTPKMERAIKRAKHVRVEIVDFEARQFRVHSTTRPGVTYLVDLTIAPNGDRLGQCECVGFRYSGECTHRAAAVGFYRGVLRSRQEAEKLAATVQGEGAASEPEQDTPAPAPAIDPADGIDPQRVTVCSSCGRETTYEYCELHPTALDIETTLDELSRRDREAREELFRRLLDEWLAEDARPKTLYEEMMTAPLIRPEPTGGIRIGGWQI